MSSWSAGWSTGWSAGILPALLLLLAPAHAGGGWEDWRMLEDPDAILLTAPSADFELELSALLAEIPAEFPSIQSVGGYEAFTLAMDRADLETALADSPLTSDEQAELLCAYTSDRLGILNSPLVDKLPCEFVDYLHGVRAWKADDLATARASWEPLARATALEAPYRAVWASFMLARSYQDSDVEATRFWCERTRDLVRAGAHDSLGCAQATYGLDMRVAQLAEDYPAFIQASLLARAGQVAGDKVSMRRAVRRLLGQIQKEAAQEGLHAREADPGLPAAEMTARMTAREREGLVEALRDPWIQRVIVAHLLDEGEFGYWDARVGTEHCLNLANLPPERAPWEHYIDALRTLDIGPHAGADRLALLAYEAADFAQCRTWLAHVETPTTISLWLQAKLALREGRLTAAGKLYETLTAEPRTLGELSYGYDDWDPLLARNWDRRLHSEAAAVQMRLGNFPLALRHCELGGFWWDAAYLAEWVLTPTELTTYVDTYWPAGLEPYAEPEEHWRTGRHRPAFIDFSLRTLLARRLTRLERFDQARPYFRPWFQPHFEGYVASIQATKRAQTNAARAEALMTTARFARWYGTELFGVQTRHWRYEERRQGIGAEFLPVTATEISRVAKHAQPWTMQDDYYRVRACELAWEAASLMPKNSERLAAVLCEAGAWMKDCDPAYADRFYKALVTRCRQTPLGQEADAKRWFPSLPLSDPYGLPIEEVRTMWSGTGGNFDHDYPTFRQWERSGEKIWEFDTTNPVGAYSTTDPITQVQSSEEKNARRRRAPHRCFKDQLIYLFCGPR